MPAQAFCPATHIKFRTVQTRPENCGELWFWQPEQVRRGRAGLTISALGSSRLRCRSHCHASADRQCCRSTAGARMARWRPRDAGWQTRRESGTAAQAEVGRSLWPRYAIQSSGDRLGIQLALLAGLLHGLTTADLAGSEIELLAARSIPCCRSSRARPPKPSLTGKRCEHVPLGAQLLDPHPLTVRTLIVIRSAGPRTGSAMANARDCRRGESRVDAHSCSLTSHVINLLHMDGEWRQAHECVRAAVIRITWAVETILLGGHLPDGPRARKTRPTSGLRIRRRASN